MSDNKSNYQHLLTIIRSVLPLRQETATIPLTITEEEALALLHVVHDVGGQPDGPIDKSLHEVTMWEINTHASAECLAWRGHWVAEERRRRENDLGETLYFGTSYYARWLLATVKMLLDKGLITPDELLNKLIEVRQRELASQ